MAIAFDAVSGASWNNVANPSFNHTCSVAATIILLAVQSENFNCTCPYPTSAAYGGAAMSVIASRCQGPTTDNFKHTLRVYYLVNPPSGLNTVTITSAGWNTMTAISTSYSGVDISDPYGGTCSNGQAPGVTTIACTATGVTNGMFYYAYGVGVPVTVPGFTFSPGTHRRTQAGVANLQSGQGDESWPAGGARSHTAEWNDALWPNIIGLGLKPAAAQRGRTIKYFYDFFSPEPRVLDEKGRVVPPNEIRPDEWIEAEGLALPSMEIPQSAIEEAGRSRIVEVSSSDRSATLKTSKSQFAQVLIERAAAGRG